MVVVLRCHLIRHRVVRIMHGRHLAHMIHMTHVGIVIRHRGRINALRTHVAAFHRLVKIPVGIRWKLGRVLVAVVVGERTWNA